MKRIGFNATYLDPYPAGIGKFIIETLNEFYKIYPEIVVFTGYPKFLKIDAIHRVILTSRKFFPSHGKRGHFHRIMWAKTVLPRLITKYKIDIFINLWPEGPIYPRIKTITVVHDLQPLLFPGEYGRMTYYFKYIVPLILRNSFKIISISQNTKKDLIKFFNLNPEKIEVIYPGVDVSYFNEEVKKSDIIKIKEKYKASRFILTVGDHFPRKNFIKLIESFSQVNLPHKLIIAGKPHSRFTPLLMKTVKKYKCEDKVVITGYVPREELRLLYKGAELFIFPSLYEGFGRPPLEAMSAGTPVIASNASSIPEVVGDAAVLIDPENTEQIKEAIVKVLRDEKLREELKMKGKSRIKMFTSYKFCQKLLKLLERIS